LIIIIRSEIKWNNNSSFKKEPKQNHHRVWFTSYFEATLAYLRSGSRGVGDVDRGELGWLSTGLPPCLALLKYRVSNIWSWGRRIEPSKVIVSKQNETVSWRASLKSQFAETMKWRITFIVNQGKRG
jgi:hypothetical protein